MQGSDLSFVPTVIAHRGASAYAPENTLSALARAADLGAHGVEIDVMLTRDGVPVIVHDETLERCSNGRGAVADHDLTAVQALDAGSWFAPEFAGERIPTLIDAIELIIARGMMLNLEIKPAPKLALPTVRAVVAVLSASWPAGAPLLLSSANEDALTYLRDEKIDYPCGLIVNAVPADWRERLDRLGCESLHCAHHFVSRELVDAVHETGRKILAYTVNDPARADALFAMGVDGVFSDCPDKILPPGA